jgi:hypothetical protein
MAKSTQDRAQAGGWAAGAILWLILGGLACARGAPPPAGPLTELPGTVSQSLYEGANNTVLTFQISNPGNCALAYVLTATTANGKRWLSVAPASGTVAANGTPVTIAVTLDVKTPALLPGTYTGTIKAEGTCVANQQPVAHSPAFISVNLSVVESTAVLGVGTGALGQDVDTLRNQWSPLSNEGGPVVSPQTLSQSVGFFTGRQLLVTTSGKVFRYQLSKDLWSAGASPPSGFDPRFAAWADDRLLQADSLGPVVRAYNPATDAWTSTPIVANGSTLPAPSAAIWTGKELWTLGNFGGNGGARLVPAADGSNFTWTAIPALPLTYRVPDWVVWTGTELIVWGGAAGSTFLGDGARYDGARWTVTSAVGAPSARGSSTAVWTGARLLVWGGVGAAGYLGDGHMYLPDQDRWLPMAAAPIGPRGDHTAVWTGARMIVWGGRGQSGVPLSDGAIYNPVDDTWTATSAAAAPLARYDHGASWTGAGLLIFGGHLESASANTLDILR